MHKDTEHCRAVVSTLALYTKIFNSKTLARRRAMLTCSWFSSVPL